MGALATGFLTVVFTGVLVSVAASIFLMRDSIQANVLADPRLAAIKQAIEASGTSPGPEQWQLQAQFYEATLYPFLRDHALFILQTIAVLVLVGVLASVSDWIVFSSSC